MKTAERTRIAFERGTPDRVPIHCWLGLPLIRELKPKDKSMTDMLDWWIDDPMGSIVKMQQDLGLDPMITTYSPAHRRARDLAAHALPAPVRDRRLGREVPRQRDRRGLARAHAPDQDARRRTRLHLPHRGRLRHVLPRLPAQGRRARGQARGAPALPARRPLRHVGHEGHGREGRGGGLVAAPRHRPVGHGGRGARTRQPLDGHLRPPAVRARPHAASAPTGSRASTRRSARPASTRSR